MAAVPRAHRHPPVPRARRHPRAVSGYTVGGTVIGAGGLRFGRLKFAQEARGPGGGYYALHPPHLPCHSPLQISANGAFTLDSVYPPPGYSGGEYVAITQQPSSPTQHCVISNAASAFKTPMTPASRCPVRIISYVTNAADNTLSAYSVDATTGALTVVGTPTATGASPYAIVGFL